MFSKRKIYLAGPITGLSYNVARHGWRKDFAEILKGRGAEHIECFSPMREKEFLEKDQCIGGEADYESLHGFGTPQGILTRDHNDVFTCDLMVANFLGAEKVSIGTCAEFGFAHAHRKPVIAICEKDYYPKVTIQHDEAVSKHDAPSPGAMRRLMRQRGYSENFKIVNQYERAEDGMTVFRIEDEQEVRDRIIKNPHSHVFLRAIAGYWVPTLEHAADIAQSLLTPGL